MAHPLFALQTNLFNDLFDSCPAFRRDYNRFGMAGPDLSCSDIDPLSAACYQQLAALTSKFAPTRGDTKRTERVQRAIEAFLDGNSHCESVNHRLRASSHSSQLGEDACTIVTNEARRFISNLLSWKNGDVVTDVPNFLRISALGGYGPGTNVGVTSDDTSYFNKITGDISCYHQRVGEMYKRALLLCRADGHCSISDSEYRLAVEALKINVVKGNTFFTVAKNSEIDRGAASEALAESYFQHGYDLELRSFLRRAGLDLAKQPTIQRLLAYRGSTDGSIATLDLKNASNSLSIECIRSLWPREHFLLMMLMRAPSTRLPDGSWVDLEMMASMGNGFTFPVETITFLAICYGVYRYLGLEWKLDRNVAWLYASDYKKIPDVLVPTVGVFGDDIAVLTPAVDVLTKALDWFGFELNSKKSFSVGNFRESCGEDYLAGQNIRPVYLKSLATPQEIVSFLNRLVRWAQPKGIWLVDTFEYLCSIAGKIPLIPVWCQDDQGLQVPYSAVTSSLKRVSSIRQSVCFDSEGNLSDTYTVLDYSFTGVGIWASRPREVDVFGPNGTLVRRYRGKATVFALQCVLQGALHTRDDSSLRKGIGRHRVTLHAPIAHVLRTRTVRYGESRVPVAGWGCLIGSASWKLVDGSDIAWNDYVTFLLSAKREG